MIGIQVFRFNEYLKGRFVYDYYNYNNYKINFLVDFINLNEDAFFINEKRRYVHDFLLILVNTSLEYFFLLFLHHSLDIKPLFSTIINTMCDWCLFSFINISKNLFENFLTFLDIVL